MTNPFKLLEEFHIAFGFPVGGEFTEQQVKLRATLIEEEWDEVYDELYPRPVSTPIDKVKLTKELCDLLYVTIGTATAFSLPLEAAFAEVHRSNMSKLGDDGKPILRADGKGLKGPNYKEADIAQFFA